MSQVPVPGVHEVAARGFAAEAAAYQRARPSYPPAAVEWLVDRLRIGPGRRVVDLAAGTGKLTELLVGRGADLVAVEPVPPMLAQLRARLPGVPAVAGLAEALPFADGSLHAVAVAQAFHWFRPREALAELARVLPAGGRLGLIWNVRDRSVDWVDRVWTVMDRVEKHAPWRDHQDDTGGSWQFGRWREDTLLQGGPWTPFERATFTHRHRVDHQGIVDRIRSVSHVATLSPDRQATVLAEVRAILREHPDTSGVELLEVPYRVDVMVTERLPSLPA
jgi:SAM-dependent methyltransferase